MSGRYHVRIGPDRIVAGNFNGQYVCWNYDAFGNRTAQGIQTTACVTPESNVPATAAYNTKNQVTWVQNSAPAGFGYDPSGNVTADNQNQYVYDAEGRVCAVKNAPIEGLSSMTGYLYDADGNRVAKGSVTSMNCDPTQNGFHITESYVLGTGGEELTMRDGNSNWQLTNVYGAGKLLATYDTNGLHFHLTDPLGTRRMQLNGNLLTMGVPETDIQSFPFGDQLYSYPDSNAPPTGDDATLLYFTGKERDTESGNDYFGARYYASTMGRFLSPDDFWKDANVADPQSWNLYAYGRNNPLKYTDPTGNNATVSTSCSTDANNHTSCNVNISASIAIYAAKGSGLTDDQLKGAAATIKSSIEGAWSGSYTDSGTGVSYNVSTQVSVQVADSQSDASATGAQNVIGLSNGSASSNADSVTGGSNSLGTFFRGQDTGTWNYNTLGAGMNVEAHEFGHLLGINDDTTGSGIMNTNLWPVPSKAGSSELNRGIWESVNSVNKTRQPFNGSSPSSNQFHLTNKVGVPRMPWWVK